MRRAAAVALCLIFAIGFAAGTAAPQRGAESDPLDTVFVKHGRGIPIESDIELDPAKEYTFEVSGEGKTTVVFQGKKSVSLYDALYCFTSVGVREPCGGKTGNDAPLLFKSTDSKGRVWTSSFEYFVGEKMRGAIPASGSHVYRGTVKGWDGTFEAYVNPNICAGSGKDVKVLCEGGYTIKVYAEGDEKGPKLPLVVEFRVLAQGKPNLDPLNKNPPQLTSSTLSFEPPRGAASARATFTKKKQTKKGALLLEATETKGKIIHEEMYADGTKRRIKFGIHQGTLYNPKTRVLAALLKVDESNDLDCPDVGTRIAWLILIPGGGVRDTIVLQGVPKFLSLQEEADVPFLGKTKIKLRTSPCRGHSHGWQQQTVQSRTGKVRVILRMAEKRP
jgi:hypothetical protein